MRVSQLFSKTLKQAPAQEVSTNARLLTRGGFALKNMAGVYSILPLGVRVLNKIRQIIREEMDAIGGQELYLNAFQDKSIWDKTNRWGIENVMYTWKDDGKDLGLGFTHEEVVAQIGRLYIHSYKDLPKFVYQIQTKFRREARTQAGLIRNREFEMKDLYSLTRDEKELKKFYEKCAGAYSKIFQRLGLDAIRTAAHGGIFSGGSEEFQVVADVGEDTIYICSSCGRAVNKEIIEEKKYKCAYCAKDDLEEKRAIEVGNIFQLGTRFSEKLGLKFIDEKGEERNVYMGSYGIGTGRAMAAVVEVHHDEQGIRWPASVAPFLVYLISLADARVVKKADTVYERLVREGIEVLYDDRAEASPGQKFADADLLGCPYRIVVSTKTGEKLELKRRDEQRTTLKSVAQAVDFVQKS